MIIMVKKIHKGNSLDILSFKLQILCATPLYLPAQWQ